jgi:DNA end-binding protein Ku
MASRAIWKGHLRVGELICPVALHSAVSSSERVALHMLNRKTGHRLQRQFVDKETGEPVEHDDQVKGYETGPDDYIVLEPEEIAAVVPQSDKTLTVETFIPCRGIDDLYFDKPYYLIPAGVDANTPFTLLREGLHDKKVAALAKAILFRRVRTVLIRVHDEGLIATTLNFDYEVRAESDAFDEIPDLKIKTEMLDLAIHIIDTKRGSFEPSANDDKYEQALVELVRAKIEGREIEKPKPVTSGKVIDLMEALRQSAAGSAASDKPKRSKATKKSAEAAAAHKKAPAKKKSASKKLVKKTPQRKAG